MSGLGVDTAHKDRPSSYERYDTGLPDDVVVDE